MSFTRDTARSSAQKAIYDIAKALLLLAWVYFLQPQLTNLVARWNVPGAVAWGLIAAIVIGFLLLFIWEWIASGRQKPLTRSGEWDWLTRDAINELRGSKGTLVIYRYHPVDLQLKDASSIVEFQVDIFNGSVWPVALEQVTGSVKLDADLLQGPPVSVKVESLGSHPRLNRASGHTIHLRQWLSPEAKSYIGRQARDKGTVSFDLSAVVLQFRVNPDGAHNQPVGGVVSPWMKEAIFPVDLKAVAGPSREGMTIKIIEEEKLENRDRDANARAAQILERYYMLCSELMNDAILSVGIIEASQGTPNTGPLYELEKRLDHMRGELINLAPSVFTMATALDFQKPQLQKVDVKERILDNIEALMNTIHSKWRAYGGREQ